MAASAWKASLSDRSVQKIRNDVQGDWLTATYGRSETRPGGELWVNAIVLGRNRWRPVEGALRDRGAMLDLPVLPTIRDSSRRQGRRAAAPRLQVACGEP
jgi:hypothetical protein